MFFEAMDLYRTLDLKSTPMDSSHFENNLKRTINCPATRPNRNKPCTVRSRAEESDPGAEAILNGWSRSQKLVDVGARANLGSGSTEIVCWVSE